jgi:hypothetical protein
MPDNDEQPDNHYAASVIPRPQAVQQANPSFVSASQLTIPNAIKSGDGMSDSSFLASLVPLASASSPMNRASQDVAQAEQKAGQ